MTSLPGGVGDAAALAARRAASLALSGGTAPLTTKSHKVDPRAEVISRGGLRGHFAPPAVSCRRGLGQLQALSAWEDADDATDDPKCAMSLEHCGRQVLKTLPAVLPPPALHTVNAPAAALAAAPSLGSTCSRSHDAATSTPEQMSIASEGGTRGVSASLPMSLLHPAAPIVAVPVLVYSGPWYAFPGYVCQALPAIQPINASAALLASSAFLRPATRASSPSGVVLPDTKGTGFFMPTY